MLVTVGTGKWLHGHPHWLGVVGPRFLGQSRVETIENEYTPFGDETPVNVPLSLHYQRICPHRVIDMLVKFIPRSAGFLGAVSSRILLKQHG